MRTAFIALLSFLVFSQAFAQDLCGDGAYTAAQTRQFPQLMTSRQQAAQFAMQAATENTSSRQGFEFTIRIPVVVHVLYNSSTEDITDEIIKNQIEVLNRDYNFRNADSSDIPAYFLPMAGNAQIEFVLASADPEKRATTGIIHKFTTNTYWKLDDKIKSTQGGGDDAWDTHSYLNIWVGNLRGLRGYSSFPGDPEATDGVVIDRASFGNTNPAIDFTRGRTLVHEVGHWLGLLHLWGDSDCGDDQVDDTPQQQSFHSQCITGVVRNACNQTEEGEMYMNYMDYTPNQCLHMFTQGQTRRMRSYFATGAARASILESKGLDAPLYEAAVVVPVEPVTKPIGRLRAYPNPLAQGQSLTLDLSYDSRWVGQELNLVSSTGSVVRRIKVNNTKMQLSLGNLPPGLYILSGRMDNQQVSEKLLIQ